MEDIFHLGIKALIRNNAGDILLLKVNKAKLKGFSGDAYWDIPGGRINKDSTIEETLKREIEEETALTSLLSFSKLDMVLSNNIRIPLKDGSSAGLILAIYLCEMSSCENISISDEHTEYKWCSPKEASELLKVKYPTDFTDKITKLQ
jgi:8-oxo-dGTP diphosphatase